MQSWKRVDRLLEAVARLGDGVNCVVLGDGPARPGLERRATELGIPDRVAFVGWKKHVGDYIQLLDAFVLPSGPEEAFGNAAVEAMGLGIPTVVFEDGGGLVEHVVDRETGLVVSDTDDLARALSELAAEPALRMHLGGAGRRRARDVLARRDVRAFRRPLPRSSGYLPLARRSWWLWDMSIRRYAHGDLSAGTSDVTTPFAPISERSPTVDSPDHLRASPQRHVVADSGPATGRDLLADHRIPSYDRAFSDNRCHAVVQVEAAADLGSRGDVHMRHDSRDECTPVRILGAAT